MAGYSFLMCGGDWVFCDSNCGSCAFIAYEADNKTTPPYADIGRCGSQSTETDHKTE